MGRPVTRALVLLIGLGLPPLTAQSRAVSPGESSRVTRLTYTGARNGQPFFSPDGEWLSFVSDRGGSWQVWLMRADGTAPRQITRHPRPVGWPSWSRSGDSILYYAEIGGRYQLLEIDLKGGEPRPLLEDAPPSFRPSLSPDGSRLLFDSYGATEPPNHDLFVLDRTTRRLTQLTDHRGYDSDARWSPDGRRIVFHSDRDGEAPHLTQVYVMSAEGTEMRRLTSGPAVHSYPAWSPGGEWIVYASESDGNRDLWAMDSDGDDPRRLTHHSGFDSDPIWSPDGGRIVFTTDRYGDGRELAALDVGEDPRSIPRAVPATASPKPPGV